MAGFVDSASAFGSGISSLTTGTLSAGGSDTALIAFPLAQDTPGFTAISSVTWNVASPQNLTEITSTDEIWGSNYWEAALWGIEDPTSATDDVTVNYASNNDGGGLCVGSFDEVDSITAGNSTNSGSSPISLTITGVTTGDIAVVGFAAGATGAHSEGTGITEAETSTDVGDGYTAMGFGYRADNGALSWSKGSTGYGLALVGCRLVDGGGAATITDSPTAGTMVLAGSAPGTRTHVKDRPTGGQLTLTGFAPATRQIIKARPTAGTLVLSGSAPADSTQTPQQTITDSPGPGSIVLTGFAPRSQQLVKDRPISGSLVLTGVAPRTRTVVVDRPTAGALTLTGLAPGTRVKVKDTPTAGTLVLVAFAPATRQQGTITDSPAPGGLQLNGFAPTTRTVDPTAVTDRPAAGGSARRPKPRRRRRELKWPRRVKVGRKIYEVRSEFELRKLLERYDRELQQRLDTEERKPLTPARARRITMLRSNITRAETRKRDIEAEIRAQEEELLLLVI